MRPGMGRIGQISTSTILHKASRCSRHYLRSSTGVSQLPSALLPGCPQLQINSRLGSLVYHPSTPTAMSSRLAFGSRLPPQSKRSRSRAPDLNSLSKSIDHRSSVRPPVIAIAPFLWEELPIQSMVDFIVSSGVRPIYHNQSHVFPEDMHLIDVAAVENPRSKMFSAIQARSSVDTWCEGLLRFVGFLVKTLVNVFHFTPLRALFPVIEKYLRNSPLYFKIDKLLYLTPDERLYAAYLNFKLKVLYRRLLAMAKMFVSTPGDHHRQFVSAVHLDQFDQKHLHDSLTLVEYDPTRWSDEYVLYHSLLQDFNLLQTERQLAEMELNPAKFFMQATTDPSAAGSSGDPHAPPTTPRTTLKSSNFQATRIKSPSDLLQMEWVENWMLLGQLDPFGTEPFPDFDPVYWTTDIATGNIIHQKSKFRLEKDEMLAKFGLSLDPKQLDKHLPEGHTLRVMELSTTVIPKVPDLIKFATSDLVKYQLYRDGYTFRGASAPDADVFLDESDLSPARGRFAATTVNLQDLLVTDVISSPDAITSLISYVDSVSLVDASAVQGNASAFGAILARWRKDLKSTLASSRPPVHPMGTERGTTTSRPSTMKRLLRTKAKHEYPVQCPLIDRMLYFGTDFTNQFLIYDLDIQLPELAPQGDEMLMRNRINMGDMFVFCNNLNEYWESLRLRYYPHIPAAGFNPYAARAEELLGQERKLSFRALDPVFSSRTEDYSPLPFETPHVSTELERKRQSLVDAKALFDRHISTALYTSKTPPPESPTTTIPTDTGSLMAELPSSVVHAFDLASASFLSDGPGGDPLALLLSDVQSGRIGLSVDELENQMTADEATRSDLRRERENLQLQMQRQGLLNHANPYDRLLAQLDKRIVHTTMFRKQLLNTLSIRPKIVEKALQKEDIIVPQLRAKRMAGVVALANESFSQMPLHSTEATDMSDAILTPAQRKRRQTAVQQKHRNGSPYRSEIASFRPESLAPTKPPPMFSTDSSSPKFPSVQTPDAEFLDIITRQRTQFTETEAMNTTKLPTPTVASRNPLLGSSNTEMLESSQRLRELSDKYSSPAPAPEPGMDPVDVMMQLFPKNPISDVVSALIQPTSPQGAAQLRSSLPLSDSRPLSSPGAKTLPRAAVEPKTGPQSDYIGGIRRRDAFLPQISPQLSIFQQIQDDEPVFDLGLYSQPPESLMTEPFAMRMQWILQPLFDLYPRELIDLFDLLSTHQALFHSLPVDIDPNEHYEALLYLQRSAINSAQNALGASFRPVSALCEQVQIHDIIPLGTQIAFAGQTS